MANADVSVLFTGAEEEMTYSDVRTITFINGESHGQGPVGGTIVPETKRLILHSNRCDAVLIDGKSE
jgi:hypothetical protein